VGRTANSWRTWNARLQHIRANCIALDAETPRDPEPSTRWAVFLRNHREVIAAMDFFTVPTLELWRALLFRSHRPMTDIGFFILMSRGTRRAHGRRSSCVKPSPTIAFLNT
jgi:hypothetical protein